MQAAWGVLIQGCFSALCLIVPEVPSSNDSLSIFCPWFKLSEGRIAAVCFPQGLWGDTAWPWKRQEGGMEDQGLKLKACVKTKGMVLFLETRFGGTICHFFYYCIVMEFRSFQRQPKIKPWAQTLKGMAKDILHYFVYPGIDRCWSWWSSDISLKDKHLITWIGKWEGKSGF